MCHQSNPITNLWHYTVSGDEAISYISIGLWRHCSNHANDDGLLACWRWIPYFCVCVAHLHQAYNSCVIRSLPSQTSAQTRLFTYNQQKIWSDFHKEFVDQCTRFLKTHLQQAYNSSVIKEMPSQTSEPSFANTFIHIHSVSKEKKCGKLHFFCGTV